MTLFNYIKDNFWSSALIFIFAVAFFDSLYRLIELKKKNIRTQEVLERTERTMDREMVNRVKYEELKKSSDKTTGLVNVALETLAGLYPSGLISASGKFFLVINLPVGQVSFERPYDFFYRPHGQTSYQGPPFLWDGTSGDLTDYRFDKFIQSMKKIHFDTRVQTQ